ncbi:hypothetical protein BHM03_00042731 [Ensete ventricosum]|nr:hypothetical protein BHM03_00042731 [Ensete ventricosum]
MDITKSERLHTKDNGPLQTEFFGPVLNPGPPAVTTEALLGLTNQVQALAEMMQVIIPHIPQLAHPSVLPQSAPQTLRPNKLVPWEDPLPSQPTDAEGQCFPHEDRLGTPKAIPGLSTPIPEPLSLVNRRLDEVQKEFIKSKEELDESSKFLWSLIVHSPSTVLEMLQRANQYITAEIMVARKHEDQKRPYVEQSRGQPLGPPRRSKGKGAATYGHAPYRGDYLQPGHLQGQSAVGVLLSSILHLQSARGQPTARLLQGLPARGSHPQAWLPPAQVVPAGIGKAHRGAACGHGNRPPSRTAVAYVDTTTTDGRGKGLGFSFLWQKNDFVPSNLRNFEVCPSVQNSENTLDNSKNS